MIYSSLISVSLLRSTKLMLFIFLLRIKFQLHMFSIIVQLNSITKAYIFLPRTIWSQLTRVPILLPFLLTRCVIVVNLGSNTLGTFFEMPYTTHIHFQISTLQFMWTFPSQIILFYTFVEFSKEKYGVFLGKKWCFKLTLDRKPNKLRTRLVA
jgi:hypothetical protein